MLLKSPKYKNNLKSGRKENGMMKKMTLLLAGMMTVSMLGGGAAYAEENADQPERNLTMICKDNASSYVAIAIEEALKMYQEEVNPNFNIDIQYIGDTESYIQKLKTLVSADEVPDIFTCDMDPYAETLYEAGIMMDMDEIYKRNGWYDQMVEGSYKWARLDSNGKQVGICFQLTPEVCYYNTEMFEEAGCEVPTNLDEFLEVCQKLSDKGYTPISIGQKSRWHVLRYMTFVSYYREGNDFLFGLMDGTKKMNSETGLEAINFVASLAPYINPDFTTFDTADARDYFLGGNAAMYFMGSWDLPYMQDDKLSDDMKGKIDCFVMPGPADADTYDCNTHFICGGGNPYCFNAETFDEETERFLVYLIDHYGPLVEKDLFSPIVGSSAPGDTYITERVASYASQMEESIIPYDCRLDANTYAVMAIGAESL